MDNQDLDLDFDSYQVHAESFNKMSGKDVIYQLQHAVMGLCGEVGEFSEPIKKHIYGRKPLDGDNLVEELGDILWYLTAACSALDVDLADVASINIKKLSDRYVE